MSIKIKMRDKKWRIEIENETFEFEDKNIMIEELLKLIQLKDTFGREVRE